MGPGIKTCDNCSARFTCIYDNFLRDILSMEDVIRIIDYSEDRLNAARRHKCIDSVNIVHLSGDRKILIRQNKRFIIDMIKLAKKRGFESR